MESGTLFLLAGLDRDAARTRQQVAHRTGLAFSEVATLQRRALRHLRAAAAEGTCGGEVYGGAAFHGQGPTDSTPAALLASWRSNAGRASLLDLLSAEAGGGRPADSNQAGPSGAALSGFDEALEALPGYPVEAGLLLALAGLALLAAPPIYRRYGDAGPSGAVAGVAPLAVGLGNSQEDGALAIAETDRTDPSTAMPGSAWVEIFDEAGGPLTSVPGWIEGGSVRVELPSFPPGTLGTIEVCTDEDGSIYRDSGELEELPSTPVIMVVDMN